MAIEINSVKYQEKVKFLEGCPAKKCCMCTYFHVEHTPKGIVHCQRKGYPGQLVLKQIKNDESRVIKWKVR
jgi:hypothetical protein